MVQETGELLKGTKTVDSDKVIAGAVEEGDGGRGMGEGATTAEV